MSAGATNCSRGALLLHGLTASPSEFRILQESLVNTGWEVATPLLPGHGGTTLDLAKATEDEWIKCAQDAALDLSSTVGGPISIVGSSMGALLGLLTAHTLGVRLVDRLVMLAPPWRLKSPSSELLMCFGPLIPKCLGPYLPTRKKTTPTQGRLVVPYESLPGYPWGAAWALARLRSKTYREVRNIPCPTLILTDPFDHLVEPTWYRSGREIFKSIGVTTVDIVCGEHELMVGPRHTEATEAINVFLTANITTDHL